MKHRAFTTWEIVICLAIIVILAAILYPALTRARGSDEGQDDRYFCARNLNMIYSGLRQYAQDTNRMPSLDWGVVTYIRDKHVFQCPSVEERGDANTTDYFYNARLASLNMWQITDPVSVILVGDGESNQPINYTLAQLPVSWVFDSTSPARRHHDGANYLFADGHTKWFKPDKITLDKPSANRPTFLVR